MKDLGGIQCPGCSIFVYDWSGHITCLFNTVMRLKDEVTELQDWNRKLRRALNEEGE